VFWVGEKQIKNELPKDIVFLEINKISSAIKLLKCKTYFFTQMHRPDISRYNVYWGATLCLLDHGNVLKKWAMDAAGYNGELEYNNFSMLKKIYTSVVGENHPYQFITVSSHRTALAYKTALAYRMNSSSRIIETGLPRNDVLVYKRKSEIEKQKEKYANLLGFSSDKKIILYVPTFRRKKEKVESFTDRSHEETIKLEKLLDNGNAIILEKNHFAADKFSVNREARESDSIVKISVPVDVQEIMEFADVLISDYSSIILDFLIMDRPMILYAYDYDEYKNEDSGLYYEIDEYAPGAIAYSFEEVCKELTQLLINNEDHYKEKRATVKKLLATYDDGHSSERIVKEVLLEK
jgi:CDP-glycerol glycerophosphotransferase